MRKTSQLTEKPSILKRIFSPGYPCVNSTLMCNFPNPSPLMPQIWHADNFTTIWNPSSPILGTIPLAQQTTKGFYLDLWSWIWLATMGHFLIRVGQVARISRTHWFSHWYCIKLSEMESAFRSKLICKCLGLCPHTHTSRVKDSAARVLVVVKLNGCFVWLSASKEGANGFEFP